MQKINVIAKDTLSKNEAQVNLCFGKIDFLNLST